MFVEVIAGRRFVFYLHFCNKFMLLSYLYLLYGTIISQQMNRNLTFITGRVNKVNPRTGP